MLVGLIPLSASAAAPVYTVGTAFPVAVGANGQIQPDIDYPWIVWKDGRECPCKIYAYNFVTGEERQISESGMPEDATNPSVSGDWVVWHQELDNASSIWAYNLTTEERIKIADGEADGDCYGNPAIDGTTVVFRYEGDGGIYAVDLADADPEPGMWQVSEDDGLERYGPEVGDGWAVCRVEWYDTAGWVYDIEAYDLSDPAAPPIVIPGHYTSSSDYISYDGPSTDAGKIVYMKTGYWDYTGDTALERGYAIMLYDIATDTEVQISAVADNADVREHPVINDGLVSWHDYRTTSGYAAVYCWDAVNGERLLRDAVDSSDKGGRTTTADGIVAWHDHRAGDGDDSYSDVYAMFVDSLPPVAVADAYGTTVGVPLSKAAPGVLANDTDPDADPLTASLVSGTTSGALMLNANGSFTYTPDAGFVGTDSFTYVAHDGTYESNPVTVTIVVIEGGGAVGSAVYRFYNPVTGAHFFTSSLAERNDVLAKYPNVWFYEGVAFVAAPAAGTVPLHRFYNASAVAHFYTASEAEKAAVLAKWPTLFAYEGTTYSVALSAGAGRTAVYRFYNTLSKSHFYTTSSMERDNIIGRWSGIYHYEGVAYYVVSS